jgi:hypothetical protein
MPAVLAPSGFLHHFNRASRQMPGAGWSPGNNPEVGTPRQLSPIILKDTGTAACRLMNADCGFQI